MPKPNRETTIDIEALKIEIRTRLKAQETAVVVKVAKAFNVDVKPYAKMGPGLQRMNIVNSICGAAARGAKEGMKLKDILALIPKG